jgi:hypothetical protein
MVGLRLSGRVVHAAPLFLAAALLATTGLALQLVPLVRSAGQVVARRSHRLAWRLGGHRASHEPRSVVRILAGLVALVVVGHVTFAVLADLRLALGGGLERVVASVAIDEAASSRLDALLGVRPDAALMALSEDRGPAGSAMVAYLSCQTIERIDQVGPCRPGSSFRVGTDGLPTDVPAGASYRLATRSGASTVVVAPSAEIDDGFHLLDSTTIAIAGRLPSDPPAGTEVRYLVDRSDLASLEAEVAEIDPALIVQSQIDVEKLAAYDQHVAVARFGALAGVLLATSCFVVASVDRLLERRSHLATLVAIGVPRWVLRESQVAQLVVPMATALAMANGVGWLVAQGYLAIGGLASGIAWRSLADGLAISAAAMVVASSAALLISVPSDLVTHLREE